MIPNQWRLLEHPLPTTIWMGLGMDNMDGEVGDMSRVKDIDGELRVWMKWCIWKGADMADMDIGLEIWHTF